MTTTIRTTGKTTMNRITWFIVTMGDRDDCCVMKQKRKLLG